ncbi:MAG: glycosyltransferase [Ignavibacteria bacterium]|nr:glycosyltransferase [Ignavibacteria bacterium]MBI3766364.1 glycosyltransferase [Ignavibacteriales bacterium]
MKSNRTVLVIAYYFPPMGLSGVQRTLKFVKYLPQFGWQPTILTVTPTGYFAQDYTLLEEIHPHHIDVERVGSLDPNRLFRKKGVVKMPSERWRKILTFLSDTFFIPDNKIGWKRKALKAATELFEKKKFDVVFATAPPFTDFLIGAELAKKFHKPLVLDYRDPWHEYPTKYYPTPFHKWKNYLLEKEVLHTASRIITTNRRVKELLLKRYKFLEYNDITIIPQGFDPQDLADGAMPVRRSRKMRITHAGVFYGGRTPKYFLQALKNIFAEQPRLKEEIEASFVGNIHDEHLSLIKSMRLEEIVTTTGYLDHARCIQHLRESDVLWFMLNNDRQSPGKVYEYFGLRKPILACIPDGFLRQTIKEAGASVIVDPTDVGGIASGVLHFYELFKEKKLPAPKEDVVMKYDRIELTNELSKIFGFLAE